MARTSAETLSTWTRLVWVGSLLLIASLYLDRAKAVSYEDFYGTYGGQLGIPSEIPATTDRLPGIPGWLFVVPALGQLGLAFAASWLGLAARHGGDALRPEPLANWAGGTARAVVIWIGMAVVAFPGLDAPPLDRLTGTWVAAGAGLVMCVGLLGLMRHFSRLARDATTEPKRDQ